MASGTRGGGPGTHFVNPYAFAPAIDRTGIAPGTYAGDYDPSDPARGENALRYWEGRYSGTIGVRMTVETPLVLTRTPALRDDQGHKTYACLDTPPATALKGMLRAAYETLSNSRYGVLNEKQHSAWVGMRRVTDFAQKLVPVLIERSAASESGLVARLLCGATPPGQQGRHGALHAAWIKRYDTNTSTRDRNASHYGCKYPDGTLPRHRDRVVAELVPVRHPKKNFMFFGVSNIWRHGDPDAPRLGWNGDGHGGVVEGHVCVTGPTIKNKHDERVFFSARAAATIAISNTARARYEALIRDYQEIHVRDLARGAAAPGDYLGHEPGKTAFGPYVYEEAWKKLNEGDLLHALVENGEIKGLYPAMIPRDLHPKTVLECMHKSVLPAKAMAELSPADRLFGWVNPNGSGAWRGKLRVTGVEQMRHPDGGAALEDFGAGQEVPLAILGAPKITQARFYLGDEQGRAPNDGLPKDQLGYDGKRRARGRKLYWRPSGVAGDDAYWRRPWEDRTAQPVNGHHQEYRQPGGPGQKSRQTERTDQNRSITGWIRPGAETTFQVRVENATPEELGGLLALLQLNALPTAESACLRLGFGKPLGLGCVRLALDIDRTDLRLNDDWRERYATLGPSQKANAPQVASLIAAHQKAMVVAYARPRVDQADVDAMPPGKLSAAWRGLPFVQAFLAAACGPPGGAPVHYPRSQPKRTNDMETLPAYKWFVANEKFSNEHPLPGLCLPDTAAASAALPYEPVAQQGGI